MNIYLIGYMGCGKSTVGKNLARRLSLQHIDLDEFFEKSYKISITDFFKKYDETAFRSAESLLLEKTSELKNHIISTGGGTPCFNNNIDFINENGFSIYLKMAPKSLFDRLKVAKRPRPLIQNLSYDQLIEKIISDLHKREVFYNRANLTVKGENVDLDALEKHIAAFLNL
jgi:shikimate kinase